MMILLDLTKSSEVNEAGDWSNCVYFENCKKSAKISTYSQHLLLQL